MSSASKINFPKNEATVLYEELIENYSEFYENSKEKLLVLDSSASTSTSPFWKEIINDTKKHINPNFRYSGSTVHKIFFANRTEKFERSFKKQAIEDLKELNFYYVTQIDESKVQNEEKADDTKQSNVKIKDVLTSKKTNTKQKDISLKADNQNKQIVFQIKNKILLSQSVFSGSSKNVRKKIKEEAKHISNFFIEQGLEVIEKEEDLKTILKDNEDFSITVFNSLLCYLFARFFNTEITYKDFNENIKLPEKYFSKETLITYNALFQKIITDFSDTVKYKISINSKGKVLLTNKSKKDRKNILYVTIISILITAICVIIWTLNLSNNKDDSKVLEQQKCIFTPDKNKHQILILPFKDINSENWKKDKGFVIKERLDSLNKADNLNIEVKFCKHINPKENDPNYFKKIREEYNANHIIYGFYSDQANCDSNSKDYVCLNYATDFEESLFGNTIEKNEKSFGLFEQVNLKDISKGSLQADLDFLIYYNAVISSYRTKRYDKVLRYTSFLLNKREKHKGLLYLYQGFSFRKLQKIDLALINLLKSLNNDNNDKVYTHALIGMIYGECNEFKRAKYHLEKSININPSDELFGYLYFINQKIGYHYDNVNLSERYSRIYSEEQVFYLKLKDEANWKLGKISKPKKDRFFSEELINRKKYKNDTRIPSIAGIILYTSEELNKDILKTQYKSSVTKFLKNKDTIIKDLIRLKTFYPEEFKKIADEKEIVKFYNNVTNDTMYFDLSKYKLLWPKIFALDKHSNLRSNTFF